MSIESIRKYAQENWESITAYYTGAEVDDDVSPPSKPDYDAAKMYYHKMMADETRLSKLVGLACQGGIFFTFKHDIVEEHVSFDDENGVQSTWLWYEGSGYFPLETKEMGGVFERAKR